MRKPIDIRAEARQIARLIELWDNRAMALDGPVGATMRQATPNELKRLYTAAKRIARAADQTPGSRDGGKG